MARRGAGWAWAPLYTRPVPTPVRPNIQEMRPYQPGRPIAAVQREFGLETIHKLASNENPLGPSPRAIEAMRAAVGEVQFYPVGDCYDLRAKMAERFGVPGDRLIFGAGSDELLELLGMAFLGAPDDEVLTCETSFPRYDAVAGMAPCRLVKTPLTSEWRFDLIALARLVSARTKLVFLANPNNPTGTIVDRHDLDRFIDDLPAETLLVLDEAYFEYAVGDPGYADGFDYVRAGRNVIALRTFSKAYGLAGMRVGYGFGPGYVVEALERCRSPFNVNSLGQAAALAALDDAEHLRRSLETNRAGLAELASLFQSTGCEISETRANFHFVDLKRPALPIFEALMRRGFIVRPVGLPNHLRVTVGTAAQNASFAEAFRKAMGETAA